MRFLFLVLVTLSLLFLSGCSTRGHKVYTHSPSSSQVSLGNAKNTTYKTKVLYIEYEKWKAVPYKLGGISLNGVDCSSFIQQVYYDAFGLALPRTTLKQLQVGHEIKKNELQVGDIIFFKTGWDVRHVGIIIENGKFLHASTSSGVTVSSIYNPYWKSNYYQSRRVLP